MASYEEKNNEQLDLLEQEYPNLPSEKLQHLYERFNGNLDQIHESLTHREYRACSLMWLEEQYGSIMVVLQDEDAFARSLKKSRLLRTIHRFKGDINEVRFFLNKLEKNSNFRPESRPEYRERLKQESAAELATAGLCVNSPLVVDQLVKYHGDVKKVIEVMQKRQSKKEQFKSEIDELKARGVDVKNKKVLFQCLEKAQGQVDLAEKLLRERKEKIVIDNQTECMETESFEMTVDDWNYLAQMREAGLQGNPMKLLTLFHLCHQSIELTRKALEDDQLKRQRNQEQREKRRISTLEVNDAYLTLNKTEDWPSGVEYLYFDGNNMLFMIKRLRQACLEGQRHVAEKILGNLVTAWNEQQHISNVQLVFDSTLNTVNMGTVQIISAQPSHSRADAMILDRVQQNKNSKTMVVTSDRALAIRLKRENCLLLKPFTWFTLCISMLAPELVSNDGSLSTSNRMEIVQNLEELIFRLTKIEI